MFHFAGMAEWPSKSDGPEPSALWLGYVKPAGAVGLDGFWRRRGYAPMPGMSCTMRWKQVDTAGEVVNTLDFWRKRLVP